MRWKRRTCDQPRVGPVGARLALRVVQGELRASLTHEHKASSRDLKGGVTLGPKQGEPGADFTTLGIETTLLPRNPATGLPSLVHSWLSSQPTSLIHLQKRLEIVNQVCTRDHDFLVLTNETTCTKYFYFADVPLFPIPSHSVLALSTCGRASCSKPSTCPCNIPMRET